MAAALASTLGWLVACGDGADDAPILVLSAFPAEIAPLLARTDVAEIVFVDDRPWRVGTLSGTPVVVGLTGIGLVNAERSTRAALERFAVRAVVFSGVAGSPRRIGDVVIPAGWRFPAGEIQPVDPHLLAVARRLAAAGEIELERCTALPSAPSAAPVCLEHAPALFVGGIGESDDPFAGMPLPCQPGGDDVFGCDVTTVAAIADEKTREMDAGLETSADEPAVADMETAAVGRAAAAAGAPFIAFRAVSDGAGDPLGLPGFPSQFFAYYRLAARNAALAAIELIEALRR